MDSGATVNPVWPDATKHLGNAVSMKVNQYISMGRTGEAAGIVKNALNYAPGDENLNTNLGVIYQNTNKLDSAEIYYLRTLSINQQNKDARANLSIIYNYKAMTANMQRNIPVALEFFKKAYNLNPQNEQIKSNFINILIASGDTKTADQIRTRNNQ
jgi:tetratricopeptide (TPR) repeat protein